MGFAAWAQQPTTVTGTVNSAAISWANHVTEFEVDSTAEVSSVSCNNKKYAQDGGVLSYGNTARLTTYDLRKAYGASGSAAALTPGAYWTGAHATYACEGASGAATAYGTLTVNVVGLMRCTGRSFTEINGRKAVQSTFDIVSTDGSTAPVTFAVS